VLRDTLVRLRHRLKAELLLGGAVTVGPDRPVAALTFDDGPDPDYTPRILDILAERRVRATFFLLGRHVERAPEIARRVAEHHEVGCHSYAHAREAVHDAAAFQDDLARFHRAAEQHVGARAKLYRFPWGDRGRISPRALERTAGLTCVHWTISGADDTQDAPAIVSRISRGLVPGAIVLLHDGIGPRSVRRLTREPTVQALPAVIDAIRARGLSLVTVGELLR
jgi:peptidoglycan/xylan/chitin deacetylase (PgdA/CDA1 family)